MWWKSRPTETTNIQNTRLVSSACRTPNLGRKAFRLDNIVWWLIRWRDRISDNGIMPPLITSSYVGDAGIVVFHCLSMGVQDMTNLASVLTGRHSLWLSPVDSVWTRPTYWRFICNQLCPSVHLPVYLSICATVSRVVWTPTYKKITPT